MFHISMPQTPPKQTNTLLLLWFAEWLSVLEQEEINLNSGWIESYCSLAGAYRQDKRIFYVVYYSLLTWCALQTLPGRVFSLAMLT